MKEWKSQPHVMWDCKCHKRAIHGKFRKKIDGIIRGFGRQKGVELHEGHTMPDHIHLLLSMSTRFSVANTGGFI